MLVGSLISLIFDYSFIFHKMEQLFFFPVLEMEALALSSAKKTQLLRHFLPSHLSNRV